MTIEIKAVSIIGLGYVGLPLAIHLSNTDLQVIGFDINQKKIDALNKYVDPTEQYDEELLRAAKVVYTSDPSEIGKSDAVIIAVPTPITKDNKPDLRLIEAACVTVGQHIKKNTVVVLESTVYPGVTEEVCVPILEKESGMTWKKDFFVGYSPERINPGDTEHTLDKVVKVVAGDTAETTKALAKMYKKACHAGVYEAPSIQVAEAEKVVENIQRDMNIAIMNELSNIFTILNIDTHEVLKAAGTKWNFHNYFPGLVGGHCIGVDPCYLIERSREKGYDPKLIAAGRALNESMASTIAKKFLSTLSDPKHSKVLVLGLTFKEDVGDIRNSKSKKVIDELLQAGVEVVAHDPVASASEVEHELGLVNEPLEGGGEFDGIIYLVAHKKLRSLSLETLKAMCKKEQSLLFDLKRVFIKEDAKKAGFNYLHF